MLFHFPILMVQVPIILLSKSHVDHFGGFQHNDQVNFPMTFLGVQVKIVEVKQNMQPALLSQFCREELLVERCIRYDVYHERFIVCIKCV